MICRMANPIIIMIIDKVSKAIRVRFFPRLFSKIPNICINLRLLVIVYFNIKLQMMLTNIYSKQLLQNKKSEGAT